MLNRAVTVAGGALSNFVHLFRTSAPLAVPLHYASTLARYFQIKKRYRAEENDFREAMKAGRFSTDWFSQKIPFWLHTFQSLDLFRKDLDILTAVRQLSKQIQLVRIFVVEGLQRPVTKQLV